jgi:hypothetical protein
LKQADDELYWSSQSMVARAFAVSIQTIKAWISSGAPGRQSQGYPVTAWCRWFASREREKATISESLTEARRRKLTAEADLTELRRQKARAEVVPVEEHKIRCERIVRTFIGILDRQPTEMGAAIATGLHGVRLDEVSKIIEGWNNATRWALVKKEEDNEQPR